MNSDHDRQTKLACLRRHGALNRRAEKVQSELFAQSEFFDAQDLMQVKYEMVRAAQQRGRSVSEVTREFGLSRPAFYHAKQDFEQQGVAGLLPRKRGPKAAHKLTAEVMSFIERVTDSGEAATAQELCGMIGTQFDTKLHVRTVQRALQRIEKKGRRK